jgi:FkbM family methyltransferase
LLRELLRSTVGDEPPATVGLLGDHISDEIRIRGAYDADLLDFLEREVFVALGSRAGRCLDVGANIGNHTLRFARNFEVVEAFEPSFRAAEILETNLRINRVDNVRVHRIALSDRAGSAPLLVGKTNLGASRLVETTTETAALGGVLERETVTLARGDEVCAGPVAFVKIDVEGHELSVISGLSRLLRAHHPVLLLEHLGSSLAPHGSGSGSGHAAFDELVSLGYRAYEFHRVRRVAPDVVDDVVSVLRGRIDYALTPIERFERRDYPWVLYFHEQHSWRARWA